MNRGTSSPSTQIHSINPLQRLNAEIKRRPDVVGIFPNEAAITRLLGALLSEQNRDEVTLLDVVQACAADLDEFGFVRKGCADSVVAWIGRCALRASGARGSAEHDAESVQRYL